MVAYTENTPTIQAVIALRWNAPVPPSIALLRNADGINWLCPLEHHTQLGWDRSLSLGENLIALGCTGLLSTRPPTGIGVEARDARLPAARLVASGTVRTRMTLTASRAE